MINEKQYNEQFVKTPAGQLFTEDFQRAWLHLLLTMPYEYGKLKGKLPHNLFSTHGMRVIAGKLDEYYEKNGKTPSFSTLESEITLNSYKQTREDGLEELAIIRSARMDEPTRILSDGISILLAYRIGYIAQQALDNIHNDGSVGDLINTFKNNIEGISRMTLDDDSTLNCTKDNLMRALTETQQDIVPTYIKGIDERIGGGLYKRDVGLFVAPTGFGKTTASAIFAANAAMHGKNVLYIYFEDEDNDIIRKMAAKVSGRHLNDMVNLSEEDAETLVSSIAPDGVLLPTLTISHKEVNKNGPEVIENAIMSRIERNAKPDLVIIDYFDCLMHNTGYKKDLWTAQKECMQRLKAIAQKYDTAMWVMQQTNRSVFERDGEKGLGSIQGSYAIAQPASTVIILSRTKEQKQQNKADILFEKTRRSQCSGDLENITFDNSRLIIDTSDNREYVDDELLNFVA